MRIGLFGYGRFGRFAAPYLGKAGEVYVYDPFVRAGAPTSSVKFASLHEVASQEVLILAVPISAIEECCRSIAPHLRPGALVADVCSVKIDPLHRMEAVLPPHAEILGTHPLFGPDSAGSGIEGLKIALCPVRCNRLPAVRRFLEGLGLNIIETTPEDHDRAMAETQSLFHLLARALQELGAKITEIATPGPERLWRDLDILQHDSYQLFVDLQQRNPFAGEMRHRLIQKLVELDAKLTAES